MKKLDRKFLAIVAIVSCFLNGFSYAQQTRPQTAKVVSDAQSGNAKDENFVITGKVLGASEVLGAPDTVKIHKVDRTGRSLITTVKNGSFQFLAPKNMAGFATLLYVHFNPDATGNSPGEIIATSNFMIDDSVTLIIDKKSREIQVEGGRQNQANNLYNSERSVLSKKKKDLRDKRANGFIDSQTYDNEIALVNSEMEKQKIQFIIRHPYAWKSMDLLTDLLRVYQGKPWKDNREGTELKEYKKLYYSLEKPVQEIGEFFPELLQNIEARSVLSFTGEMPDGSIFDLASLKGKVFLIDFWGSWCGPCRAGHPHMKELYIKYKDKGFEIIGVAAENGTREEQWKKLNKAIAEDDIPWPQILNDATKQDLTKEYAVPHFPFKILVDRQGKVLLTVGSDKERLLDAKLEELFDDEKLLIRGRVIQSPDLPSAVDTVTLLDYMGTQFSPAIKAAVVNDEFQLRVPSELAGRATLKFIYRKQRSDGSVRWSYLDKSFMIEDTIMDILVDKKLMQISITGGRQNQALNVYNSEKDKLADKYNLRDLQRNYSRMMATREEVDTTAENAYRKAYASVSLETDKLNAQFITDHPYSWQALYLLDRSVQVYLLHQWKNDPEGSELKEYKSRFLALEKPVREKGHYLLELLQDSEAARVPSFTGEMPDGKLFDLANLKGKVILIDFWGSWCAACRKGHPHLKELYAKYKDKGFEIVGVGVETGSREEQWRRFKEAIDYDGITWPQVLNNSAERDLFAVYGIKSCPTKLLVDRNGRLLLRISDDRERLIDAKLEELFDGDSAK